ncbi:protein kinase domain-containing protein [Enterobacter chuandaensis]|uniref:protein kinase domain-containing protein n=1 Tax=Enterobacter chuandaensis TaxID=2497875 RepID=UPI003BE9823B
MSQPSQSLSPAKQLTGEILNERWLVGERILVGTQAGGNGTGGHFSVSYQVESLDKTQKAFLKAFDFHETLMKSVEDNKDVMAEFAGLTSNYQFENKLNEICISKRFKKIVKVLDKGQKVIGGNFLNVVPYLIMELADSGDIRKYVEITQEITLSAKLEYLKDVAVGLNQLHSAKISHQDLKPSNVMIFSDLGAKIGDLGRASLQGQPHWHDSIDIAGDRGYAPPEQLYGYVPPEWIDRRERCDLYQLGSLVTFLFLGVTINGLLKQNLPLEVAPSQWGGAGDSYVQSLHHIEHAFNESITNFDTLEPRWLSDRLKKIVIKCSHPDYTKRGMIQTIGMKKPILGLDRLVSEFDYLIKQVNIKSKLISEQR